MGTPTTTGRVLSPNEKLATGRLKARESMPYFSAALHALTPLKIARGTLGTYGVTPNSVLLVDDEATEAWSIDEIGAVLLHEALHIIRDHHRRGLAIGIVPGAEADAKIWNLATDAEINDDLAAAGMKLPGSPVFPSTFGLEPGGTAELYFAELRKLAQRCPRCGGSGCAGESKSGDEDGDGDGSGDAAQGAESPAAGQGKGKRGKGKGPRRSCPLCGGPQKPMAGGGWCGSGGGRPVPGEPDRKADVAERGRSDAELASLRRRVAQEVQDAVEKNRGTVPGGLARWAEEQLRPPRVNWRLKLAQVARAAVSYRPGAVDFRFNRPSRRQAAVGVGIGHPVLPALVQPVPRVAIAIDTSGSMSKSDISIAVEESSGVLAAVGAEVSFLACDAEVGAVRPVRTARELAESLVGGGGTDFGPVFSKIGELHPRPEVLVYATDGCGPAPLEPPPGLHTIWLLVGRSRQRPWFPGEPWGDFVEVDDDDETPAAA